jgi:hypothetical protein
MLPRIDRRRFLSGLGISLALPSLESGRSRGVHAAQSNPTNLQRLVCIGTYLGFHQASFFPSDTGTNYKISPVLNSLESFRNEMTIFSGLDHRGRNGHEGWKAWMTGTATGGVSMDELVAASIGDRTRFASLQLTCGQPPSDARLNPQDRQKLSEYLSSIRDVEKKLQKQQAWLDNRRARSAPARHHGGCVWQRHGGRQYT